MSVTERAPAARDESEGVRTVRVGLLPAPELPAQIAVELADELPISRPAVSRHLRLLKDAGLVEEEPHGTRRIYRLQEYGVAAVREYLLEVWGDAGARFALMAENTDPDSRDA